MIQRIEGTTPRLLMTISREAERTLNLLASLIGIGTFVASLAAHASPTEALPSLPEVQGFPLKLILFALFQGAVAKGFAWPIVLVANWGAGFPWVLNAAICFTSAWSSLFLAQWIFYELPPWMGSEGLEYLGFFLLSVLCAWINIGFLSLEAERGLPPIDNDGSLETLLGISFAVGLVCVVIASN